MDLDLDQVLMYILHGPLFTVVGLITSLYQIAARTTDTRVKEMLIAVAKQFMNALVFFEVEHHLDLRIIKPPRYFKVISFALIAKKSSALRLACAYAAACSSAAALVITKLVDKITDEEAKNVLRHLIEEFNRISREFQSVSDMIFRDQRPIDPEIIRPLILQNIRPWIPYVPPFPVPRVGDELVFSGLLTEPMLGRIFAALYYLEDAIEQTYWLFISLENDVAVDRLFNVLTYMVIAQSFLEHHFPLGIKKSRPEDEDRLVWDRRRLEVHWMLSQVSDIMIMAMVEIGSLSSLSNISKGIEQVYECLHYSADRLNHASTAVKTDSDSDSNSDSDYELE